MLTGISYLDSLKIVYPYKKVAMWNKFGTYDRHILRALKRAGLKSKKKKAVPFSKLRTNAIVIIEHLAYGPPGENSHAVVWDYKQQRILDPMVGFWLKRHLPVHSYEKSTIYLIEVW